jgi:hypothetical protein
MLSARGLFLALVFARLAAGADDVRLCDLLKNPNQNQGKELIITSGFRVGYEWQALVCYDCTSQEYNDQHPKTYDVWVNFEKDVKGASKLPKVKAFDQLEKVIFQGTFEGPGTYGHLGGYRYQFNVREIKSAVRLWKLNRKENDAPADVKASVCRRDAHKVGAQQ